MSLKDVVNSIHWEEVEAIVDQKMRELALDFPPEGSQEQIAVHALANKKAHNLLKNWMSEMNFYKGEEAAQTKRDYR